MWPNANLSIAASVALVLATAGCAQAAGTGLHVWCNPVVTWGKETIQCHVRSLEGNGPTEATATLASGRRLEGKLDSYSSGKHTTAWYFLIQQSGVTPAHLEKMTNAVGRLASYADNRPVAVATYTDSLEQHTQFGAFERQVEKSLLAIQFAPPSTRKRPVALYKAARDAIYKFDSVRADRKVLVLLSNGVNDDGTVTEKDVIDLARKKDIIILGLIFGDKSIGRPQNVSRLAEQTFGIDGDFSDQSANAISSFASNYSAVLENGVVLTLNPRDLPEYAELTLSARFGDSTILTAAPVAVRKIMQDTFYDRVRRLMLDNFTMLVAAAALTSGLLLILMSARARRQTAPSLAPVGLGGAGLHIGQPDLQPKKEDLIGGARTTAVTDTNGQLMPDNAYAWLQFLDAGSTTRIPVVATALRIGRHQDNDLCLQNRSVHRQHAVLHKTSNGDVIIRDLGTKNGIIVNGKRCSEHNLVDNDLIELGEVRLRIFLNKEAAR